MGVLSQATSTNPSTDAQLAQSLLERGQVETPELGRLAKLTPFGPVAIRLLRLFDRDDLELAEVVKVISAEAALTSEILALANSPLFGVTGTMTDLRRAVAFLGIERTRSLAFALSMRSLVQGAPKTPVMRRVWRHGVATAVLAELLAPLYGLPPDLANTSGIMHDVGRVGLLAAFPEQYSALAVRAYESHEAILLDERTQFGLDHCQAGQFLSEAWKFPPEFQQVVARHLELPSGRDVVSLVQTSCRLAANLGFAAINIELPGGTSETIATHVPASIQPRVAKLLKDSDRQILERIESLDF